MVSDKLEKLRAKREEMNAKIRKELGRDRAHKRRQDTRRKIIAGALVLTEEDPTIRAWLKRTVDKAARRRAGVVWIATRARGAGRAAATKPTRLVRKKSAKYQS